MSFNTPKSKAFSERAEDFAWAAVSIGIAIGWGVFIWWGVQ
jgi:hypothetical protein